MVKKRNINETITFAEEAVISTGDTAEETANPEENSVYPDLLTVAQEIRKNEEVIGYILKGELKATVDLNDSTKIIEYAMLATQAFESSEMFAESCSLGDIENIVVEGKSLKALCVNIGQNQLSIFMKRDADHASIMETLMPDHTKMAF
jgi:predicted regulator of Ras-like GTPase activity (Roadblock/LC7/MglB family)